MERRALPRQLAEQAGRVARSFRRRRSTPLVSAHPRIHPRSDNRCHTPIGDRRYRTARSIYRTVAESLLANNVAYIKTTQWRQSQIKTIVLILFYSLCSGMPDDPQLPEQP